MIRLVVVMITFVLLMSASVQAGLNPTKLWELRDSLQTLVADSLYGDEVNQLLEEIPALNKSLSRVREIIPFANLRIDVIQSSCPARARDFDTIKTRLDKHDFSRIATECGSIRSLTLYAEEHAGCEILTVGNPLLAVFIQRHGTSTDERVRTIILLCKMVQCEQALVSLGLSLREYRDRTGGPNDWSKGLLIIDSYYVEEHLKTFLRLAGAQSNIF